VHEDDVRHFPAARPQVPAVPAHRVLQVPLADADPDGALRPRARRGPQPVAARLPGGGRRRPLVHHQEHRVEAHGARHGRGRLVQLAQQRGQRAVEPEARLHHLVGGVAVDGPRVSPPVEHGSQHVPRARNATAQNQHIQRKIKGTSDGGVPRLQSHGITNNQILPFKPHQCH